MKFSDKHKELDFLNLNKKNEKKITPYSCKMFCDAGSRNNNNEAAIGVIVYDKNDNIEFTHSEYIGSATCNVAEYVALYTGIKLLQERNIKEVNIYMDSDLVVHQVNGNWKCINPNMVKLCSKVKSLLNNMKWNLTWIPREQNKEADILVNLAFRERNLYESN